MTPEAEPARASIAAYKSHLRACIERRPSGLRRRLATALGKHPSFVTQITNPAYKAPIPAGDLPTIVEICHLTLPERDRLLELYRAAHPERHGRGIAGPLQELRIALPRFLHESTQREVEGLILDFAARTIRLAKRAEAAVTAPASAKRRRDP